MTNVLHDAHRRMPPAWPVALLGTYFLLAAVSLTQGVVDVVLPAVRGEAPFAFLRDTTAALGPGFFVAYVFVHNAGLACIVPGVGLVAAAFEPRAHNRRVIAWLLVLAVAVSLVVGLEYLFQAAERFDLPTALAIFVVEASAVLALAVVASREVRRFVPTPWVAWSLVTPLRRLGVPVAYAFVSLLLVSVFEAWLFL